MKDIPEGDFTFDGDPSTLPRFIGKTWMTVTLPAHQTPNFARAIENYEVGLERRALEQTIDLFYDQPVGLDKPVKIDLVEFFEVSRWHSNVWTCRHTDWYGHQVVEWANANSKRLIETSHFMGMTYAVDTDKLAHSGRMTIVNLACAPGRQALYFHLRMRSFGPLSLTPGVRNLLVLHRQKIWEKWEKNTLVGFISEEQ